MESEIKNPQAETCGGPAAHSKALLKDQYSKKHSDASIKSAAYVIAETIRRHRGPKGCMAALGLDEERVLADEILSSLDVAGFRALHRELSMNQITKALSTTACWLDIPGSQLKVNREKMRIRYRAIWDAAPSHPPRQPKPTGAAIARDKGEER